MGVGISRGPGLSLEAPPPKNMPAKHPPKRTPQFKTSLRLRRAKRTRNMCPETCLKRSYSRKIPKPKIQCRRPLFHPGPNRFVPTPCVLRLSCWVQMRRSIFLRYKRSILLNCTRVSQHTSWPRIIAGNYEGGPSSKNSLKNKIKTYGSVPR